MNPLHPESQPKTQPVDEQRQLALAIDVVASQAYAVNVANGWWRERHQIMASDIHGASTHVVLGCLALVTSEVAEAMEAVRNHPRRTWSSAQEKDTLVRELAGTIIRCMDLACELQLPLGEAIIAEIEANKARGYKHGGKAA